MHFGERESTDMRVLIDTNILIDFMAMRTPYEAYAVKIVDACDRSVIDGCIAAHSIPNIEYILRKSVPLDQRRETLLYFCEIFDVIGIDRNKLTAALTNSLFSDYEDCLQSLCASSFHADYIITRNPKDYEGSKIPVILPDIFCERFLSTQNPKSGDET